MKDYFELLKNQKLQVLSEKVFLEQSGIRTSIFCSFFLAIQKLQLEEPEAFQLLAIIAILDGSFIHEPFAEQFCKDNLKYLRIKRLLKEYSMIKNEEQVSIFDGHITKYLTIHSIYQQAVIFILNDANILMQTFQYCMESIPEEQKLLICSKKALQLYYM